MDEKKRGRKKRVLVLWYTADKNFGDYLIFKTVSDHLRDWGYECVDMDVGRPYRAIANAARKCDFVWFAGGGIIERGIPNIIRFFRKFRLFSLGVKYGITGLSIGDFDYQYAKKELRSWVRHSSFFYCRDDYTADYLNSISGSKKAVSSADVVFACDLERMLKECGQEQPEAPDEGNVSGPFDLGVNFRELPYVDLSGEMNWTAWTDAILKSTANVIGIPDQYDCSGKIRVDYYGQYTPENVLQCIEKCSTVLAMRFHVLLVAARMGKIPIPINYCPKVGRLAGQLGITDLVLGINDCEGLESAMQKIADNEDRYRKTAAEKVACYEAEAAKMFQTVKQCI